MREDLRRALAGEDVALHDTLPFDPAPRPARHAAGDADPDATRIHAGEADPDATRTGDGLLHTAPWSAS
jgi:hypothetical protein